MRRFLVLLFVSFSGCATELADLRPPELRGKISPERTETGAQIWDQALAAHGGTERWAQVERVRGVVRDRWHGWLLPLLFMEWEENDQPGAFVLDPRRWGSVQVTWQAGDNEGEVWRLGEGGTVRESPSGEREVDDAEWLRLSVETLEYLVGLPFRLASADQVVFVREAMGPRGRLCNVLLLSWGTLQPRPDWDQWEVWIEQDTGWLARTHYTARDFAPDATAVYDYFEPVRVEGIWLPQRIEARLELGEEPFHTYRYSEWDLQGAGAGW